MDLMLMQRVIMRETLYHLAPTSTSEA